MKHINEVVRAAHVLVSHECPRKSTRLLSQSVRLSTRFDCFAVFIRDQFFRNRKPNRSDGKCIVFVRAEKKNIVPNVKQFKKLCKGQRGCFGVAFASTTCRGCCPSGSRQEGCFSYVWVRGGRRQVFVQLRLGASSAQLAAPERWTLWVQ